MKTVCKVSASRFRFRSGFVLAQEVQCEESQESMHSWEGRAWDGIYKDGRGAGNRTVSDQPHHGSPFSFFLSLTVSQSQF